MTVHEMVYNSYNYNNNNNNNNNNNDKDNNNTNYNNNDKDNNKLYLFSTVSKGSMSLYNTLELNF